MFRPADRPAEPRRSRKGQRLAASRLYRRAGDCQRTAQRDAVGRQSERATAQLNHAAVGGGEGLAQNAAARQIKRARSRLDSASIGHASGDLADVRPARLLQNAGVHDHAQRNKMVADRKVVGQIEYARGRDAERAADVVGAAVVVRIRLP